MFSVRQERISSLHTPACSRLKKLAQRKALRMTLATTDYISAGGNRNTSAADWDCKTGQFAFGADQNVAIWKPHFDKSQSGVSTLLRGHDDRVTAVKYTQGPGGDSRLLITGSASGELRVWCSGDAHLEAWHCVASVKAHEGSLNAIAILLNANLFSTAGADATVKLWNLESGTIKLLHVIALKPRYIPLALALGEFFPGESSDPVFLVAGGTRSQIQVFALTKPSDSWQHELQATLSGHEGWIRSLGLRLPCGPVESDILLASASQDKYVRLWRLHRGDAGTPRDKAIANGLGSFEQALSNKIQTIQVPGSKYSITFEALLVGHEDWVYTAAWNHYQDSLQLLTASADNSLMVWEPDPSSGIWVSTARLGEISGQKGATTATGSAGGFWIGLWSPDGQAITCLGRTGSWRLWENDTQLQYWTQKPGMSGHVGPVAGLTWDKNGQYLLSTGADQTTRLHAEWRRESSSTWHEFARPQIHGYNLNCVTSIGPSQFVSGADEKLLRVFNEPRAVANMMARLCKIDAPDLGSMAEAANMPVLGLSNKAIETADGATLAEDGDHDTAQNGDIPSSRHDVLNIDEPPPEDVLARHTLWPEHEKLYGHGYEISEVASNEDGTIVASACKASSIDHAVIRLYDTNNWHELKPPLAAHSLTVTRLRFSPRPNNFLLSVGRDRQWTVFQQSGTSVESWKVFESNAKAHSRMILDAAWSPSGQNCFFATAGRDKLVKLWQLEGTTFIVRTTISRQFPITSIDFVCDKVQRLASLAVGEENGKVSIHVFDVLSLKLVASMDIDEAICPSKAVTRLAWRPQVPGSTDACGSQLAVASADASVRVMHVKWECACRQFG
jgi:elongator complex protein 2